MTLKEFTLECIEQWLGSHQAPFNQTLEHMAVAYVAAIRDLIPHPTAQTNSAAWMASETGKRINATFHNLSLERLTLPTAHDVRRAWEALKPVKARPAEPCAMCAETPGWVLTMAGMRRCRCGFIGSAEFTSVKIPPTGLESPYPYLAEAVAAKLAAQEADRQRKVAELAELVAARRGA